MERVIIRGDLYYADLNPVIGSEQGGTRPVLLIQNNTGNKHSPTVIVAAVTSKKKAVLPTHVPLAGVELLRADSIVLLEQIRTIDKQRLKGYIGALNEAVMAKVNHALAVSVGLQRMDEPLILCLCSVCAQQFYDSPNHVIRRVDPGQKHKELCTYCNVRTGYDFEVRERIGLKRRYGDGEKGEPE